MTGLRTIVGGRPSEDGPGGAIPRGIEVLLKKARIDDEFREVLVADPMAAAAAIELDLTAAEEAVLRSVPGEELRAMASRVEVPEAHRHAFRGKVAAAMLATLAGVSVLGCGGSTESEAAAPSVKKEPREWGSTVTIVLGVRPRSAHDEGVKYDDGFVKPDLILRPATEEE